MLRSRWLAASLPIILTALPGAAWPVVAATFAADEGRVGGGWALHKGNLLLGGIPDADLRGCWAARGAPEPQITLQRSFQTSRDRFLFAVWLHSPRWPAFVAGAVRRVRVRIDRHAWSFSAVPRNEGGGGLRFVLDQPSDWEGTFSDFDSFTSALGGGRAMIVEVGRMRIRVDLLGTGRALDRLFECEQRGAAG